MVIKYSIVVIFPIVIQSSIFIFLAVWKYIRKKIYCFVVWAKINIARTIIDPFECWEQVFYIMRFSQYNMGNIDGHSILLMCT